MKSKEWKKFHSIATKLFMLEMSQQKEGDSPLDYEGKNIAFVGWMTGSMHVTSCETKTREREQLPSCIVVVDVVVVTHKLLKNYSSLNFPSSIYMTQQFSAESCLCQHTEFHGDFSGFFLINKNKYESIPMLCVCTH